MIYTREEFPHIYKNRKHMKIIMENKCKYGCNPVEINDRGKDNNQGKK